MRRSALLVLLIVAVAAPLRGGGEAKGKKPRLDLRATPRFSFSPAQLLFTGELVGGDDVEDLYCPELEWYWDDGGKSVKESDCPPFEAGVTKIDRRYTAHHEFVQAGIYTVQLTLRHTNRVIARQTLTVTVRPGLGDRSNY